MTVEFAIYNRDEGRFLMMNHAYLCYSKVIYITKNIGSAPNLKSHNRTAMPYKQTTVAIVTVMATRKHRQGSADITVK